MTFKTVENTPKKRFTVGKVLLVLLIIDILIIPGLVGMAYLPQNYRDKDHYLRMTFTFNIILIILLFLSAVYYIFFRTKNEKYIGTLELRNDAVLLNDNKYSVEEIEHLRFSGNDVKGDFRGFNTKGNNNEIFLTQKNGNLITTKFEQTVQNNLRKAEAILTQYKDAGILTEANLDTIKTNSNYY